MQGDKISAARRIIEALPQYELVKERVDWWIGEVQKIDPERIDWHALRLSGFGGSEIGSLVLNWHEATSFARDVVREKLLLSLPEAPTSCMRRGVMMEPIHRIEFLSKYGLKQDKRALGLLSGANGALPWMRYSPDDICLTKGGKRILVDYKSPSEVSKEERFEYTAQLLLGLLVGDHVGIKFDGAVLSELAWEGWGTNDFFVERDEELMGKILEAGNYYWNNYVLKGEVPTDRFGTDRFGEVQANDFEVRKERMRA